MFSKEKPPRVTPAPAPQVSRAIETIIGPNAYFKGDIQSDGNIRIDGIFEGRIDIAGNLVIWETAKVIAEISANNVSISGAVKGNITGNRIEILKTGRVWGDLTVKSLILEEGAYFRGQTMMHGEIEPPLIEPPKKAQPQNKPAAPTIVDVEPKPVQE
ncbi:MAG: polymer-forming cytoskeletal protein [Anaerolineae bacterium]|nr:polymer-forming cytoskeletal protein [Anaerolineae bacterium]